MGFAHSLLRGLAVSGLATLAACSDDAPSVPAASATPAAAPGGTRLQDAAVAGYWQGSTTDKITGTVTSAIAMIDANGDAQLIMFPAMSPGARSAGTGPIVIHANVCCGSTFQAQASSQPMVTGLKSSGQIAGTLSSDLLIGEFTLRGIPYSFSLALVPLYNEPLTLRDLAGVYTSTLTSPNGGAATATFVVDDDGQIIGSHTNGCVYNGEVSVPDPRRNLFRMNVQLSSCGSTGASAELWNGNYTGMGVLLRDAVRATDPSVQHEAFYYSLIGPVWLGTQGAER